jgi:hypothetical protein
MIDTKEILPGNYVQSDDGVIFKIEYIEGGGDILGGSNVENNDYVLLKDYKVSGIPLNSEVLGRLGFVGGSLRLKDDLFIDWNSHNRIYICSECQEILSMPHIQHVHQIQNLHKLLTGNELNFIDNK